MRALHLLRTGYPQTDDDARSPRGRAAFTLIELLAVVAIFALMAAVIVPNLGLLQARTLSDQAQQLADRLELARQRSIVTGSPHRLFIDLDAGSYRLEWLATPDVDAGDSTPGDMESAWVPNTSLSLAPPRNAAAAFRPMPGIFGLLDVLEPGILFAGIETDQGFADSGETSIEFESDGTTDGAILTLESEDGAALILEVAPLAEAVRIVDAKS